MQTPQNRSDGLADAGAGALESSARAAPDSHRPSRPRGRQGGKGRSGLMAAALLLWSGHRRCAMDALELFTFRRTRDYRPEVPLA